MKVTDKMINKWARAGFLIVIAIVFLMYLERILAVLEDNYNEIFNVSTSDSDILFTFLTAILYIFVLWLFVAAALNILSSFREPRMTIDNLGAKIDSLEKKLGEEEKPAEESAVRAEQPPPEFAPEVPPGVPPPPEKL